MTRASLLFALFFSAVPAPAQTQTAEATTTARAHFQQGLARARAGDVTAALRAFEDAYAAAPHFSVLYNIGQARATLGRYVEAAAAFERYLADGGEQVDAKRHEEVEALLEFARSRIGQLRLLVEEGADRRARVWLDGVELSRERWDAPIPLSVGPHSLLYTIGTTPPQSSRVTIVTKTVVEARLRATPTTPEPKARLVVACSVPDVRVEVVGIEVTKTPVPAQLLVPAGPLVVKFSRPGYLPVLHTIWGESSKVVEVSCNQREVSPLPPSDSARLVVSTKPADADVTIDGRRFTGAPLPRGVHWLRVERDGYRPHERLLSLAAGKVTRHEATLVPTPASLERQRVAVAKRRGLGLVLSGIGVAVAGTGAGVYAWNSGRYEDWRLNDAARTDYQTATSIQRVDDASLGLMVVGGAMAIAGSWLFLGSE